MHRGCRGIAYGRLLGLTDDPILPATKPFLGPLRQASGGADRVPGSGSSTTSYEGASSSPETACTKSPTSITSSFAYRRCSAPAGAQSASPSLPFGLNGAGRGRPRTAGLDGAKVALSRSLGARALVRRHIATAPDGRARVSLSLVDPRAAIAFVLSWADAVRVVEPPELESAVSQVLARAASRYS